MEFLPVEFATSNGWACSVSDLLRLTDVVPVKKLQLAPKVQESRFVVAMFAGLIENIVKYNNGFCVANLARTNPSAL